MTDQDREAFIGQGDDVLAEELLEDGEGHEEDDDEEGEAGPSHEDEDMADDDYVHDTSAHCFEGHQESVYAVAWSPVSATVVATGGGDDKAFLWHAAVGDSFTANQDSLDTFELSGHTDTVGCLGFNSDGTILATGGMDGKVFLWEVSTGKKLASLEGPGEAIEWLTWHPRGNVVVAGSADFTTWMWNAQTAQCMQVFTGHSGSVICGQFTPDGKHVLTGGEDGSFRVWNPRTGDCSITVQGHPFHEGPVTCMDVTNDSQVVLTGGADATLKLLSLKDGAKAHVVGTLRGHEDSVSTAGFSRVHALAASGGTDGKAIIWDLNTTQPRGTCDCEADILKLKWQSNGPCFFTTGADATVRMWDSRTGACVLKQTGHEDCVLDLALSPDGMTAITGSDDRTARIWEFSPQAIAQAAQS